MSLKVIYGIGFNREQLYQMGHKLKLNECMSEDKIIDVLRSLLLDKDIIKFIEVDFEQHSLRGSNYVYVIGILLDECDFHYSGTCIFEEEHLTNDKKSLVNIFLENNKHVLGERKPRIILIANSKK